jgi:hypothetical protein
MNYTIRCSDRAHRSSVYPRPNQVIASRPVGGFKRDAKSIRRGNQQTAPRVLRAFFHHDPSSAPRRLLIIACAVRIGALDAVVVTAARHPERKSLPKWGGRGRHLYGR